MRISIPTYDAQQEQNNQLPPPLIAPTPPPAPTLKRQSTISVLKAPQKSPRLAKPQLPRLPEKEFHKLDWGGASTQRGNVTRTESIPISGTNPWGFWRRGDGRSSASFHQTEPSPHSGTPAQRNTPPSTHTTSPVQQPASPDQQSSRRVSSPRFSRSSNSPIHGGGALYGSDESRPSGGNSFSNTGGLPPDIAKSVPADWLVPQAEVGLPLSASRATGPEVQTSATTFTLKQNLSNLFTRRGNGNAKTNGKGPDSSSSSTPSDQWVFRRRVHLPEFPEDDVEPEIDVNEIPEHLPTSPLCPANPKYRGGRLGSVSICPVHGRPAQQNKRGSI